MNRHDRERLEHCFERCARRAWRLARAWLRSGDDASDAVQQAFLVAARKPERIPSGDPWPWFSTVLVHEVRNARRKMRPTLFTQFAPVADPEGEASFDFADPHAEAPTTAAMREEDRERLWGALDSLPEAERTALVLTYVGGMTHAAVATALEVPRQTVTARIRRGLEKLRGSFRGGDERITAALAVYPVGSPPGGWESALVQWQSAALTASSGSSAALAVGGGIVMKKGLWGAAAAGLVALGFWSGFEVGESKGTKAPETTELAVVDPVRLARDAEEAGWWSPDEIASHTEVAATRARAQQEEIDELRAERDALVAQLEEARTQLSAPVARSAGPTFTFGEFGALAAIREANWEEMADASLAVGDAIAEIYRLEPGTSPEKAVLLSLQENVERMRKYEYRTIDKLPTSAKHNGELTHPITLTNLLAARLARAGLPLSEGQIEAINELGERFEAEFAALRASYPDGALRAQRVLDEYLLKGAFTDDLDSLLTAAQRDEVHDPETHRIASLDLYCPSLMIIHTSPLIVGTRPTEIRDKFRTLLQHRYALSPETEAGDVIDLDAAIDAWWESCTSLTEVAVHPARAKNYTFDQSVLAGEATVALLREILSRRELTEESRTQILEDPAFFIPRLTIPSEA